MGADERLDPERDRLLDTHDLRALLKCSRNTVTRLIHTGKLRALRIGRAVRFHPDDVRRCIEELRK